MELAMTRQLYESFVHQLSGRVARINYDTEYDTLYIASDMNWSPAVGEKPRTFTAAPAIRIDVLRATQQVFGVEITDFGREIRSHGDPSLIGWWNDIVDRRAN